MPTLEEIQRRAAELRAAGPTAGATTPSRFGPSVDNAQVATSKPSRMSAVADTFRRIVPQEVRDVVGKSARFATSGERALNDLLPGDPGTAVKKTLERVPVVGKALGAGFDVGLAPSTLLTAGFGGAAAAGLRGAGTAGKIAASLLAPVSSSPNFGARLLSETILGTGGTLAAQEAEKHDAPLAVQIAAGVFGGAAALGVSGMVRGAAGTFARDSAKAAAQTWGHNLGARTFVADLLPADTVRGEIRTSADPLERGVLGNRFVDPSLTLDTDIGKNWNTFTRQVRRGDQLSEIAAGAALDPHAHGAGQAAGRGGQLFNMDVDGNIQNVNTGVDSKNWYDVFSAADAPTRYHFSPEQTSYWKDFHQAKDEMIDLLTQKGVIKSRKEAEEALYVPRVVRSVGEAEIYRSTNHMLGRVFEEAREGVAKGIQYENDPKAVLQAYLQAGYKSLAEQQLDDLMVRSGQLVSPKSVLAKTAPQVIQRVDAAAKALIQARRTVRGQRSLVMGTHRQIDREILRAERAITRATAVKVRAESGVRTTPRLGTRAEQMQAARDAYAAKTNNTPIARLSPLEKAIQKYNEAIERQTSVKKEYEFHLGSDARTAETEIAHAASEVRVALEAWRSALSAPTSPPPGISATAARAERAAKFVEALTAHRDSLVDAQKNLPEIRVAAGPAPTPATAGLLDAAQREWHAARAGYARAMEQTKASEVLPEYLFGGSNTDKIRVGHWKGNFLPETDDYLKLADQVNTLTGRALAPRLDPFSKGTRDFADAVRFASATGDLAMPFIQGLPLLGQNPLLWAKMAYSHYRAALDPSFNGRYLREHIETLQEMAQHGVPIGDVEQMIATSRNEGVSGVIGKAARTRIGRQTVGRLEAAYDSGLTASRTLLWESLKPHWDGTPDELARVVRNMTGGLDSAALGITPTQRAIESAWMGFSPRLMRSTLALVGSAANPNSAAGRQAARSLLGLATFATTALVTANIGIGIAKGESKDEIEKRISDSLDPTAGRKFLALNVNGQYLGAGGQVRAITQFVAKAMTNPSGFATANAYENPLINFYMGRGAVGVNLAGTLIEGATGERVNVLPYESIDSLPDAVLHLGTSFMPFVVQGQLEAHGLSLIDRAQMAGASVAGLNVTQESPTDQIDKLAREQYQRPYAELTGEEQQSMEAAHTDIFAQKEKARADTGGREERNRRAALHGIDEERIAAERSLTDALSRGKITPQQFRDEMKASQRIAAERKRDFQGDTSQVPDANRMALSNWYATFDQAKVAGTDIVDWDQQQALEDALMKTLTPEQRRYVDERRKTKHAEEAQWYFDNEQTIQSSGYYDAVDTAFKAVQSALPSEIATYADLVLAVNRAIQTGDSSSARYLGRIKARVDALTERARRVKRTEDPNLDIALSQNGRVSKPLPSNQ